MREPIIIIIIIDKPHYRVVTFAPETPPQCERTHPIGRKVGMRLLGIGCIFPRVCHYIMCSSRYPYIRREVEEGYAPRGIGPYVVGAHTYIYNPHDNSPIYNRNPCVKGTKWGFITPFIRCIFFERRAKART